MSAATAAGHTSLYPGVDHARMLRLNTLQHQFKYEQHTSVFIQ